MADLLENLNEKQRDAVLETEGYVRVIAGGWQWQDEAAREPLRLSRAGVRHRFLQYPVRDVYQ